MLAARVTHHDASPVEFSMHVYVVPNCSVQSGFQNSLLAITYGGRTLLEAHWDI